MRQLIGALMVIAATVWAQTPPEGLTTYHVVFLKRGTPGTTPEIQKAHLAHLNQLYKDGFLVAAGPIAAEGEIRGVLVMKTPGLEQARQLVAADPRVKAGQLTADVFPWWGPENIGTGYAAAVATNPAVEPPMVTYQLCLLRAGPHRNQPEAEAQQIQADHLAYLKKLADEGKRVAGGPFLHDGDLRGMSVYAVPLAEARQLANADPAVKAGRLIAEFYPWMVAKGVFTAPPQ